ncbi:hypothetical protein PAPYR_9297 [Paratrimastix pyriformis]|uniref:Acyltransferase 3 domain-containing protein n=1 Tax=Paratrimastix pyriformis TaxID=342808 RepID=A0ABQ8U8Q0_9EUKA|nr:hypothetical protein PAPYR_9297 [Paratrimastix pyriformis]
MHLARHSPGNPAVLPTASPPASEEEHLNFIDWIRFFGFVVVVYCHGIDWVRWTSTDPTEDFSGLWFKYRTYLQMLSTFFFISSFPMVSARRLTYKKLVKRTVSLGLFFLLGIATVTPMFLIRGQLNIYHLWFLGVLMLLTLLSYGAFRLSFYRTRVDYLYVAVAGAVYFGMGMLFQFLPYWSPIRLGALAPSVCYVLFCLRKHLPWPLMVACIFMSDVLAAVGCAPFPSDIDAHTFGYFLAAPLLSHSHLFWAGFYCREFMGWVHAHPAHKTFIGACAGLFVIIPSLPFRTTNFFFGAGVPAYTHKIDGFGAAGEAVDIGATAVLVCSRWAYNLIWFLAGPVLDGLRTPEFLGFAGIFIYLFHPLFIWMISNLVRSALSPEIRLLLYWVVGLGGSAGVAWLAMQLRRRPRPKVAASDPYHV